MPKFILGLFALLFFGFISCSDDSTSNPEPTPIDSETISDLPADTGKTGHYTFFSLRTGEIIPNSDSATTKWDLGFSATKIITNSGYRGQGVGGAIVLKNTDFTTLDEAPADGYKTEVDSSTYAIPTGSDNGWYHYDATNMVIQAIPGVVLVIRTADGKYAKVRILNYYKGAPEVLTQESISRWYKFEYVFQPDGSKHFTK